MCTESVHLDATSLHLHGHYAHDNQEAEPEAIRITPTVIPVTIGLSSSSLWWI